MSENIDAVRELIMPDRHVTYREIEASLGISSTSIHSILHVHLAVKKSCSRWISYYFQIAPKRVTIDWCKEKLEKYDRGASKDVYKIVICAYESETKQQLTVWVFEPEPNPTKIVCGKSLRSKWWPVSSTKLVMWRLFHLSIVGRSILNGTALKSPEKFEKQTREDESVFNMTRQALIHRLKPSQFGRELQMFLVKLPTVANSTKEVRSLHPISAKRG